MAHELMNCGEFSWPGTLGDWHWIQCVFFFGSKHRDTRFLTVAAVK